MFQGVGVKGWQGKLCKVLSFKMWYTKPSLFYPNFSKIHEKHVWNLLREVIERFIEESNTLTGINWTRNWHTVAQLVEHRTSITEVMGSNPVEASEFFLRFICTCSSYFTTVKISFTSILYPQFTHDHIHFTSRSNTHITKDLQTLKADLHGTILSHTTSLRHAYDTF